MHFGIDRYSNQFSNWVKAGRLVFCAGGTDVLGDLLYTAETAPKPIAKTADVLPAKPEATRKKLPDLKGVGWMASEQQFTDGLILPVGCRVVQFDERQPHKFDPSDVSAAKGCAIRLTKETGHKPMIVAIAGYLRVLQREFLTDTKPATDVQPRRAV